MNWITRIPYNIGDYLYRITPSFFNKILTFHDEWRSGYTLSDPVVLNQAKQIVGGFTSVLLGLALFLITVGTLKVIDVLINKNKG